MGEFHFTIMVPKMLPMCVLITTFFPPDVMTCHAAQFRKYDTSLLTDYYLVMVDGTFFGDSFEQDRSWDDSGTTVSGI